MIPFAFADVAWRERKEMSKLAQLVPEWLTEVFAMRGVEGAIAEAVIGALAGNYFGTPRREPRSLKRSLDSFEAGVAED